jgi:hypothetical protein
MMRPLPSNCAVSFTKMMSLLVSIAMPQDAVQCMPQSALAQEFSYSSFQPSVAKFLKGQALRIRQYSTKSVIQIGKDLVASRPYLSHGEFLRWVENDVGLPARTAQACMRAASWASSRGAVVALLPTYRNLRAFGPGLPIEFLGGGLEWGGSRQKHPTPLLRAQIKAMRETNGQQYERAPSVHRTGGSDDAQGQHCPMETTR